MRIAINWLVGRVQLIPAYSSHLHVRYVQVWRYVQADIDMAIPVRASQCTAFAK